MWMLTNSTALGCERTWSIDKNAAKSWMVAVKGTFDIAPDGSTTLSKDQPPPLLAPIFRGEPGQSSVLYDADLAGPKKRTDVLVNGHVYAPPGRAVTEVTATLKVGELVKQVVAVGDRRWEKGMLGLSLGKPKTFEKIPII